MKHHKTILHHLGVYFFEHYTRKTGSSAEQLYNKIKKHLLLRDTLTILLSMATSLALVQELYLVGIITMGYALLFQSSIYWHMTRIGDTNAECAIAWKYRRRGVQKTRAFKHLVYELSSTPTHNSNDIIKHSRHFTNCLAFVRIDTENSSKRKPIAAFETP